jgi:hypothetical protein
MNIFPIAVERTAMGKPSAAYAAKTTKAINSLVARFKYGHFITRRVEPFCFSASQRKAKKQKTLRSLRLCGEQSFIDLNGPGLFISSNSADRGQSEGTE